MFFVNCVFLVFLFVLQLGLLCLVQRSKPCQHITLFIRQRCYQISLRLEETSLSNNYRIYIYVVPLRETLKRRVECQYESRIVSLLPNRNKISRRGIGEQTPHQWPAARGCEESLGGRHNYLNQNFSKTAGLNQSVEKSTWPGWAESQFYFSSKGAVSGCVVPYAKQTGTSKSSLWDRDGQSSGFDRKEGLTWRGANSPGS